MQDNSSKPHKTGQLIKQPQHIRDDITQELLLVRFYSDHGAEYSDVGDDSGLAYALQRLLDHVRSAMRHHARLRERKAENASWWAVYGEEYLKSGKSKADTEQVLA